METKKDYALNFIIPVGRTGPTGPLGDIGPTGPTNTEEPMIFVRYNSTTDSGNLEISNTVITPQHTPIFNIKDNTTYINEVGYYEFTISGLLTESINNSRANLVLQISTQEESSRINFLTVYLSDRKEEICFSYTRIGKFSNPIKVKIVLNKNVNSNATIEEVILVVKKYPFL